MSVFRVVAYQLKWFYSDSILEAQGSERHMDQEPAQEPTIESERHYRTIFESEMVGIIIANFKGRIFDANNYFLRMLGYTPEDLRLGKLDWATITAPEYLSLSHKVAREILEKKHVPPFEKEYLHKDGHRVPVAVGLTAFPDGSIVAVIQDLTEAKKNKKDLEEARLRLEERVAIRTQELQQSKAFLGAIFENIPNMVFVKDAKDLKFVRFNKAGEELIGVPRSELIGKSDYDFFSKEQADFFTTKDREVLERGHVEDIQEEPISTASGIRFLHTKKIPVFNKEGKAEYLLGVSEDITERKEAEKQHLALLQEQIAREEAELRAREMSFLSDLSAILTESFETGKILTAFCARVSVSMADICIVQLLNEAGESIEVTEGKARDPNEEELVQGWKKKSWIRWGADKGPEDVLRSGKSLLLQNAELEVVLRDRSVAISSVMMVPILVRDEKPVGLVSYLRKNGTPDFEPPDLSLAEEITRRLAVSIENSRLYFRAQEASRAKSAFLANVSHEIRTPLGAMLGFAEILEEDGTLSAKQKNAIQIVLRNGQQLLRIVDEILDISKVESERIQIEYITFSLPALLEDVVLLLKGRAEEKNIDLHVICQSLPSFIRTDPTRLRQILINVVGNAIKFTDVGKVEVHVLTKKTSSGQFLEFKVSDTGIGISEEQRSGLFQAFAQADSSTTRRFGGTGLGLFLSRNLARLLGGDVVLSRSATGQGSCFMITIAYEMSQNGSGMIEVKKAEPTTHFENIKSVLIVDDAPDNRDLFRLHLMKMGLAEGIIDVAENGAVAVQKASKNIYSLILMDIQMPEMDGFQALEILRKQNYLGQVVALTAHAMKGDEEKCLSAGFDGYLQKPLLKAALQRVLEQTSARLT